jgi:hypothetical protein
LTTICDSPRCGVTYDHHSDDSKAVIYICNIFIIQATELNFSIASNDCRVLTNFVVYSWLKVDKNLLKSMLPSSGKTWRKFSSFHFFLFSSKKKKCWFRQKKFFLDPSFLSADSASRRPMLQNFPQL